MTASEPQTSALAPKQQDSEAGLRNAMIQDQTLFAVVRPSVSVFNADQQGLRRGPQTFGKLLEPVVEFGSGEPSYDWGFKRRSGSGDRRYFRYWACSGSWFGRSWR